MNRLLTGLALALLSAPVPSAAASDPVATASTVPVSEGYATTPDGIRLYYRVAGEGPETVIAPFALYHQAALDTLASGRRVVTYDPRGRGKSQAAPLDRVSLDYIISDLETVRAAVGAKKAAIIAWSGSGLETFVYTMRHPDRVTRLVQLAPVPPRAMPYAEQMTADRRRRTDAAAYEALQAKIKAGDFKGKPEEQCRAERVLSIKAILADPAMIDRTPDVCSSPNEQQPALGRYFGKLFESIIDLDVRDKLASVTIPRLVIYPLQDNISKTGVKEWVQGQSNARYLEIEKSGHMPLYEQPEKTLRAIDQFLRGEWPDGAITL